MDVRSLHSLLDLAVDKGGGPVPTEYRLLHAVVGSGVSVCTVELRTVG